MGRDYSFDMWVPRERLFEAFSIIARYDGTDELAPLIWPDGRRLPIGTQRRDDDTRDLVPFDGSMSKGFCLAFAFEEDEPLRLYNEKEDLNCQEASGLYRIGCIDTYAETGAFWWRWLDDEQECIKVRFVAVINAMSDLFVDSTSVQNWFVSLAREIGACSCELDYEGPTTLLFLDGEEMKVDTNAQQQWPDSLLRRYYARHPDSDAARKAFLCDFLNENSSAHEKMEVLLCLRDKDSGVRSRALKSLVRLDKERAQRYLEDASDDVDWRVRAQAVDLYGDYEIQRGVPTLERMLNDAQSEVRIAAVLALAESSTSFDAIASVLLATPVNTANLGLIKAALTSLKEIEMMRPVLRPQIIEIFEQALTRPDFPFKNTVTEKLNIFRSTASA